jgi:hypothetical protein
MHQSGNTRDRRNRYFYQLDQLRQLADVTQTDPILLAAQLHRLRTNNKLKEGSQAHPLTSGDTTP